MGYLLTFEAPDASGKSTQVSLLKERLQKAGYKVESVRFPRYGTDACKPVEMYLGGVLGNRPEDTGAYAASVLFAVDRYFSYKTEWKTLLEDKDTVVILDRYTTSNAIHQLAKIEDPDKQKAFLDWLYDFEFGKLGLPVPNDTLFLDVPPAVSLSLLHARAKEDAAHVTDIHEADEAYLATCYKAAKFAAREKNWHVIPCTDGLTMRTITDISDEIFDYITARIASSKTAE